MTDINKHVARYFSFLETITPKHGLIDLSSLDHNSDYLLKRDGNIIPEKHETKIKSNTPDAEQLKSSIEKQVLAANNAGKPLAWGRGGVAGRDPEQYAQKLASQHGVKFKAFSLEHPDTDIEGNLHKTSLGRSLIKDYGVDGAEGVRHAFLAGQGDYRYKTKRGNNWLRRQGVDPSKQVSLYNSAFPEDTDDKLRGKTVVGKAQLYINKARRLGVRVRVDELQNQGYHVTGTFGEGHFDTN